MNQKSRRHSGRVTPRIVMTEKKDWIIDNCLEPREHWSDWDDYRDGVRGSRDKTLLKNMYGLAAKYFNIKRWNKKIRKLIFRRRAKKLKIRAIEERLKNAIN